MTHATRSRSKATPERTFVRAAIYTRKSTHHGLDSDFSSIHAQHESCLSFIQSQASLGWIPVDREYSDGGFSGATTQRPGFQRLLHDIASGEIDALVVYKLDRLSRSVVDLHETLRFCEKHGVVFVSVTQQITTTGSTGRLLLSLLGAVAEFESAMIGDRTRDKLTAARRRGRWTGGTLVLGFGLALDQRGLVLVEEEATLVREIFELYLRRRSTRSVADELNALGYRQKLYSSRNGPRGGKPWDKAAVGRLLRNPLYAGFIREGTDLHKAEHPAIISRELYDRIQTMLDGRSTSSGPRQSRKSEYLLTSILRCGACQCALTSSRATGRNGVKLRYYRCRKECAHGSHCPTGLLRAHAIEEAVASEVRRVAASGEIAERVRKQIEGDFMQEALTAELKRFRGERARLRAEAERLLGAFTGGVPGAGLATMRLQEIEGKLAEVESSLTKAQAKLDALELARLDARTVTEALDAFGEVWGYLLPAERREVLHVVVQSVTVDPVARKLHIAFHDFSPVEVDATGLRAQWSRRSSPNA